MESIDSLGGSTDCSFKDRVSEIDLIGVYVKVHISGALLVIFVVIFVSLAISRDPSVVDDPLLLVW